MKKSWELGWGTCRLSAVEHKLKYHRDAAPLKLEALPKTARPHKLGEPIHPDNRHSIGHLLRHGVPHHVASRIRPGQAAYRTDGTVLLDSSRVSVRFDPHV